MHVYRAVDSDGRQWRIEVTATAHDLQARIIRAYGRSVAGSGRRLVGVDRLAAWLVEHDLTVEDLRPW